MTQTVRSAAELRSAVKGPVLGPVDPGYDEARSLWNGDIDRRPALIARCTSAADVAAAVKFGRERGLEIAVRGGGHAYSGTAACDDGLMIDLSRLNAVTVDPQARTAQVGGGATLADLDAATQAHGLAVTGGVISHTGVGGLTLGGGMGWLSSALGLSLDNVVGAEVVLADGRIVHAGPESEPDLFWALRGGGGNFGVVTEFVFALHPIGREVQVGLFFWDLAQGPAALRFCRDYIPSLPRRAGVLIAAGLTAPPLPFVPEPFHGVAGHALVVVGLDTAEAHAELIDPVRRAVPPGFEVVSPMPYTALQQLLDDSSPWGILGYEKAADLDELSDEAIAVLVEAAATKASPMSFMPIFRLSGAFCDVGQDATAFGGSRKPHYVCNLNAVAPSPDLLAADREWVRRTWAALKPLASNAGSYVNFLSEPDADRVRASYGPATYDRLAAIKARYDPENLFHRNANIRPARQGGAA
ncbi:FAD/FMN-containing dehydrogenase [Amycolatopsis sulphurea]|uniref:FAD/FMN-containing dehydrogenase n=1 Tax=Amycolatopsis sulphurea TaxID=76022 RepID=A0A2A9FIF7_9PSEU|nr:FAD-binding oxidoreductase [Amycolatopsis sulphurea]PFG50290.1 FAD/FMN-containing dehydrogenase [Amycolatopsis sulphurea]